MPNPEPNEDSEDPIPRYIGRVKDTLEAVLEKADLSLWLMVDRLDELFPRRSDVETRALRGLLRTIRTFESKRIRIKVFLRDDILEQVTSTGEGFTALTHVAARQAATLRWSEDDILTLIVKRLFAFAHIRELLNVDSTLLDENHEYRRECFYRVFPETIYAKPNQSPTLRWIYSHTGDGSGVVTPRDVIDLLTAAKGWQIDEYRQNPAGESEVMISAAAVRFGLEQVSIKKRDTVLRAELPHLWPFIERFEGQKTEYSERALRQLLGGGSDGIIKDLVSIGFLSQTEARGEKSFKVPFLYRRGLQLSQGRQD